MGYSPSDLSLIFSYIVHLTKLIFHNHSPARKTIRNIEALKLLIDHYFMHFSRGDATFLWQSFAYYASTSKLNVSSTLYLDHHDKALLVNDVQSRMDKLFTKLSKLS